MTPKNLLIPEDIDLILEVVHSKIHYLMENKYHIQNRDIDFAGRMADIRDYMDDMQEWLCE